MRPMPIKTLEEKVRLRKPLEQFAFTRTYVKAGGPPGTERGGAAPFWQAAERTRNDAAWRYFELPCGHGIHREMPYEMAGILLGLAEKTPD
jgi:hypothetical protein